MFSLYEKLVALLERFLIAFTVWYEIRLTEKAKVAIKASEEVLETNKVKREKKNEIKKLSNEDLAHRTVIDD